MGAKLKRRVCGRPVLQGTLDRTVMFSAADEFMDMTQSHTVNIANQEKCSSGEHLRDPRSLPGASVSGLDRGFKDFLAGLSKTKPKEQGPEVGVEIVSFRRGFCRRNATQSFGLSFDSSVCSRRSLA